MCLRIFKLDPVNFLSALGLTYQAALKRTEVKLELLTDIDTLLMAEKKLEEEYVMQFINMRKLITNI